MVTEIPTELPENRPVSLSESWRADCTACCVRPWSAAFSGSVVAAPATLVSASDLRQGSPLLGVPECVLIEFGARVAELAGEDAGKPVAVDRAVDEAVKGEAAAAVVAAGARVVVEALLEDVLGAVSEVMLNSVLDEVSEAVFAMTTGGAAAAGVLALAFCGGIHEGVARPVLLRVLTAAPPLLPSRLPKLLAILLCAAPRGLLTLLLPSATLLAGVFVEVLAWMLAGESVVRLRTWALSVALL
eukprot:6176726-Pleurochrysis_carterae.AAC.1